MVVGAAIDVMNERDQIPSELCALLDMPTGASYAQASTKLMNALSGQTSLPPSDEFPRKRQSELKPMATFNPDGTVEWRQFVFDGWGNVLRG